MIFFVHIYRSNELGFPSHLWEYLKSFLSRDYQGQDDAEIAPAISLRTVSSYCRFCPPWQLLEVVRSQDPFQGLSEACLGFQ